MKKIILVCLTAALLVGALIACTPVGAPDVTPPTVSSVSPAGGATGVALNAKISATFSEAMDSTTIVAANFTISPSVAGTVTYNAASMTATFSPTANLAASTAYTATVKTGAKDSAGNALAANKVWSFTTGIAADTTPPTVASTVPADTATGVATNSVISVTFSEPMLASTMIGTYFQVVPSVSGAVVYDAPSKTLTLTPGSLLATGTLYTVTITTGVKDSAGNAMAANKIVTFHTAAAAGLGPAALVLGKAGDFAVLAETAITDTGSHTTAIDGDVGIYSFDHTFITLASVVANSPPFTNSTYATSNQVTGIGHFSVATGAAAVYSADMGAGTTATDLNTAVNNMTTAYGVTASPPTVDYQDLLSGILPNGTSLAPGYYVWGTNVHITGNISITGAVNDVWIFDMTGDLNVDSGVVVTLGGNAQAKNIFWRVAGGTGATLGTTVQFKGIILAAKQVIMETNSALLGRALAQTEVTLDATAVTQP